MEIIRKLKRHDLDYQTTLNHFRSYLKDRNELSRAILESHSFSNGNFFTLLTENADLSLLYNFNHCHILSPNPTHTIRDNKNNVINEYEWVNTLEKELSHYLYNILAKKKHLTYLFEDLIQHTSDPYIELYNRIGLHYRSHIFYLINYENLSLDLLFNAIKETNLSSHFVMVVFDSGKIRFKEKKISKEQFNNICSNINFVIIGAYDAEGFLIWEKTKSN